MLILVLFNVLVVGFEIGLVSVFVVLLLEVVIEMVGELVGNEELFEIVLDVVVNILIMVEFEMVKVVLVMWLVKLNFVWILFVV